ncbi:MAG: diguanylate cyclase [Rhodoferax sp.]|uniref:sensor domain-containing diguanylate cyclase n=1 Tax=Rhodoferax sp. TaxID=50421 RepID=UPI001B74B2AF|nr:sensor domain-containing diguanylate cyclase [Rhodoferax sp.]MBP9905345.1 diguanylate cyclase [Rhodoferax sp.]
MRYQTHISIDTERSAVLLRYAIAVLVVGSFATMLTLGASLSESRVNLFGPLLMLAVGICAWVILRLGKPMLASQVLVYGVCAVTTSIAAFTGGVRSPVMVIYPVLILSIGWLSHVRAALTLTLLVAGLTLGLWVAQRLELIQDNGLPSAAIYALHSLVVYALSSVLVVFILRAYQLRLKDLNKLSDELTEYTGLLEQNSDLLERAQAVAKIGSWVVDIAANHITPSVQGCAILGLPTGSSIHLSQYFAMVHPDDQPDLLQQWHHALKDGLLDCEHRILLKDEVRWIRQRAELDMAHGRATHALGIAQDITERKLMQMALRESEKRHRTLIEWTPEAILVHQNTRILYANPAAVRLFGAPDADTLSGRSTQDLIHPDSLVQQKQRMSQIEQGEDLDPIAEAKFLKLDGTVIDVEVQGTAIEFDGIAAIHVSIRDVTERKRLEYEIRQLAFYDNLTGLPNRRLLDDRLGQTIMANRRNPVYGALMFLDLDNFKPINDTYGHSVGDRLLVEAAHRIKSCVRETDTVARFGGDEFVVLLAELDADRDTSQQHAHAVALKILASLAEPYTLQVHSGDPHRQPVSHRCTASIGLVIFGSRDNASPEDLTKWADVAMYQAKSEGRDRISFAHQT